MNRKVFKVVPIWVLTLILTVMVSISFATYNSSLMQFTRLVFPQVQIGVGQEIDEGILFDGNAQDFYLALDDSADNLIVGLGSTVGTTPIFGFNSSQQIVLENDETIDNVVDNIVKIASDEANTTLLVYGFEASEARIRLEADQDDDATDGWEISSGGSGTGTLVFGNDSSAAGTYLDKIIFHGSTGNISLVNAELITNDVDDEVEIMSNDDNTTFAVRGFEAKTAILELSSDEADDNADTWLFTVADGGALTIANDGTATMTIDEPVVLGSTVVRTGQQLLCPISGVKLGSSGAGWTLNAADSLNLATLAASQTSENIVIPVNCPLKVGSTITAFSIVGQIESAGNTATLDADLRKHTAAAGDVADASVDTITQISVTADTAISTSKTLGTPELVAADETFYVVLLGTTAASTDIAIQGITVTLTEN